jgi:hypothetical protein
MSADTESVRFFMSNDPLRVFSKIEAVPEACLLTVIVPLRVRDGHEDAIKRLDFALMDSERPREVSSLGKRGWSHTFTYLDEITKES